MWASRNPFEHLFHSPIDHFSFRGAGSRSFGLLVVVLVQSNPMRYKQHRLSCFDGRNELLAGVVRIGCMKSETGLGICVAELGGGCCEWASFWSFPSNH